MTNVNIPNFAGQIPNFPKDAVVETNAVFSRDHIAPVYAGECPQEIAKLTMPYDGASMSAASTRRRR